MRLFSSNRNYSAEVNQCLQGVRDPVTEKSLPSSGRIDSLVVTENGDVTLALTATPQTVEADERLRYEAEQAILAIKKIGAVRVLLTAHSDQPMPSQAPGTRRVTKGENISSEAKPPPKAAPAARNETLQVPGIKNIIAVASAKGGVGKSTLSLNLAIALRNEGLKVGILDADVYGPSLPTMTNTVKASPARGEKDKIRPIEALGLKLMSIGYISDVDAPMIWRGPIVMSAISQMLKDVEWGELDILIIDTPPGTGDAQLTLAQRVSLSGAVIVSTPQEVALADVRRGVAMFRKTEVPVLGIVENMAYFEDPVSQNRTYLFGEGGARRMAEELSVPFLGEVPLVQAIREGGDTGEPVALDSAAANGVFTKLATEVLSRMGSETLPPAPEIVFE